MEVFSVLQMIFLLLSGGEFFGGKIFSDCLKGPEEVFASLVFLGVMYLIHIESLYTFLCSDALQDMLIRNSSSPMHLDRIHFFLCAEAFLSFLMVLFTTMLYKSWSWEIWFTFDHLDVQLGTLGYLLLGSKVPCMASISYINNLDAVPFQHHRKNIWKSSRSWKVDVEVYTGPHDTTDNATK